MIKKNYGFVFTKVNVSRYLGLTIIFIHISFMIGLTHSSGIVAHLSGRRVHLHVQSCRNKLDLRTHRCKDT